MYIYMAESLHSSPVTITTFLIGYSPIQNKKLKKKKEKKQVMDVTPTVVEEGSVVKGKKACGKFKQ